jgi:hypothetical protein
MAVRRLLSDSNCRTAKVVQRDSATRNRARVRSVIGDGD